MSAYLPERLAPGLNIVQAQQQQAARSSTGNPSAEVITSSFSQGITCCDNVIAIGGIKRFGFGQRSACQHYAQ